MSKKVRLDLLLVEKGFAQSRERAQALILGKKVLVNDVPVLKAGTPVPEDAKIRTLMPDHPYVSRGALKLKFAIEQFGVTVKDRVAADIGSSTGGFTEVLLEAGAKKVFAIDAGTNQLDWRLRSDPRVVSLENTNARYLDASLFGQCVDILVMDVSFISVKKLLEPLLKIAKPKTPWILLIKPQFEVGKDDVGKGGIVKNDQARRECIENVKTFAIDLGFTVNGLVESPIKGTDGNIEYLIYLLTPEGKNEPI